MIADPSPVSSALPNSLQLIIPAGAEGRVGFGNGGYYGLSFVVLCAIIHHLSGIRVKSEWTYNASFYYKFPVASSFNGTATVALQSSIGQIYASASVPIDGSQTTWRRVTLRLTPTLTPNSTANNFTVTFDGGDAAGLIMNFAIFSLFPPTFKDRENGMRIDLSTVCHSLCNRWPNH